MNEHVTRQRVSAGIGAALNLACLVLHSPVLPLIPRPIDQNWCAHWRNPMDMMRQG
jgi:hypothetical protein